MTHDRLGDLRTRGGGPEGRRSCMASHSSYPFNGLVMTWRQPSHVQVCVISQEKSLEILRLCWELNPGCGEDRQGDAFILPLSYYD